MNQIQKRNTQLDYILLDGSASMAGKWQDSLKAICAYTSTLKAENISSDVYFHIFSTGDSMDLCAYDGNLSKLSEENTMRLILPFGGTPLYDAIALVARRMRDFDPPAARITIVTDGDECDSCHTDIHQAKSYLDWMRAKGWQVVFIGCDFNNEEQASLLGADSGSSVGVAQARLVDAARAHGKKAAHHARTGDDMAYTDEEKTKFGGYLAAPAK